jgi:hypothetical protein
MLVKQRKSRILITHFLHLIFIIRLYPHNRRSQYLLNLVHLIPGLPVVHEIDGDSLAPKAASSTYDRS